MGPYHHLDWMSLLLLLGSQRSRLDRMRRAAAQGPGRLASGLGLLDESAKLAAILAVAADEVREHDDRIRAMESRCAELSAARHTEAEATVVEGGDPWREALRRSLPYALREAIMDWVRRPYVGGPLRGLDGSADPTLQDLCPRFEALLRDAHALHGQALDIDGALRLPPLPGLRARRRAALDAVPEVADALARLAARSAGQLASRRAHLRQMATYRTNLEYLMGRIDPDAHPLRSRPRPLPGVAPDQLRVLTRRLVPDSVRHAVMDWVLP